MRVDTELEKKRLRELARRACYRDEAVFTRFLEPSAEQDVLSAAAESGVQAAFWGGFEGAERRMAAFYAGDAPDADAYPLVCLEMKWNVKYASPGHRDLLGALMGLGLERDSTGDIAPAAADGYAYLFVHEEVADYVRANLESAGRAPLKLSVCGVQPELREPEGESLRVTVGAERLDAVLAAGYRLSRAEAQRLIDGGLVKLNHQETRRGDARLKQGDLISARGCGRLRIVEIEGMTRKGRLAIRLFRYGG